MIQIKPILVGLPQQEANAIIIRPIIDTTTATDCNTYYEVLSASFDEDESISSLVLANGNFPINEEQYAAWGKDNSYIENIVLKGLGLERL
jgi:hypothetical protein